MSLLELEHVAKGYGRGSRVVLEDVSLAIDAGEMVVVWGERQSGRSTLMRIAAGIEAPDTGVVRFDGQRPGRARHGETLGGGIGYCRKAFRRDWGLTVLDQLVASQLARWVPRSKAQTHAWRALERVGRCVVRHADSHRAEGRGNGARSDRSRVDLRSSSAGGR